MLKSIYTGIAAVTFCFLCLGFLIPLGASFIPLLSQSSAGFGTPSFDFVGVVKASIYTLKIALGSMLIALILGVPSAFFITFRSFPGKKILTALSAVPLCIPSLLIALGFVLSFGMQGYYNKWISSLFGLSEPPITFLYSLWGIIIAQGFYNFPLVMRTVSDAWKVLPSNEADAGRLLGASEFRIFRTITFFQLLPSIATSAILVFLYCFFSFIIVLLFGSIGGTTLEVFIYQAARTSLNFSQASMLALVETSIAFFVVFLYGKLEAKSKRSQGLLGDGFVSVSKIGQTKYNKKNFVEIIIFVILSMLIITGFIFPLFSLIISSLQQRKGHSQNLNLFTLYQYKMLFTRSSFLSALRHTVETAFSTATLSVIGALFFGILVRLVDPYKEKTLFRVIPLLPMAVSSVVMGFGLTLLVTRGTAVHLVLIQSALAWPFAYRQISSSLGRIPHDTLSAAHLLSSRSLDTIFRVMIPLCKGSILSAFGFCFAISCGDATLPLVLAIPRYETLALYTYRLAGSYRFNEACACGVILAFISTLLFIISDKVSKKKDVI
jgi:thiamine transport system permease protein